MPEQPHGAVVKVNQQQNALIDRLVATGLYGATASRVIAHGFVRFCSSDKPPGRTISHVHVGNAQAPSQNRKLIGEHILEPGTGKALPMLRGQIFRIEQLGNGQCMDFNAFNLHDYKEHFHCGRTRTMHGLFPTERAVLWSAPPRDRPMFTLIADSVGTNDVNFPRCSAFLYEYFCGYEYHTNCQDILAESLREYELTPDDVHDSFNFWTNAAVDAEDRLYLKPNPAKRGDYVELIAHIDSLVAVTCCTADMFALSNFELKPLKLQILEATSEDKENWLASESRRSRNQQTVADFKVQNIKASRQLERDENYEPVWPLYPISTNEIYVELSDDEYSLLRQLHENEWFADSDGDIVRHAFFSWWLETNLQEMFGEVG